MFEVNPVSKEERSKEDAIEVEHTPIEGSQTIVNEEAGSETTIRAGRFVDLVKAGVPAKDAAKAVGSSITDFAQRGDFSEAVKDLMAKFALDAEVQQRFVEAGLNKMFAESVGSKSLDERKHALAVAKQIGQNKGFSPSDGVTLDLGSLGDVIKDTKLPGIPEFKEPEKNENH